MEKSDERASNNVQTVVEEGGATQVPAVASTGSLPNKYRMVSMANMAYDSASVATASDRGSLASGTQSEISLFGSTTSLALSPELMIGLTYNPITSRLAVEVIKGSNFSSSSKHVPGIQHTFISFEHFRYRFTEHP